MDFREHVALHTEPGDEGTGRVVVEADERHSNLNDTVHGGLIATMIDAAMGEAVRTPGTETAATVSLMITYLEPGRAGRLEATARVRKRGRRLVVVEAEVVQDGDVLADALGTFAVKP